MSVQRVLSILAWSILAGSMAGHGPVHAGPADNADKPLFTGDESLAITLSAPFAEISRDRSGEPQWFPGTLSLSDADGAAQIIDVRVRARGKNRRKPDVCRFPPLRLDLDETQAAATVFAGQDELKLVTHCQVNAAFEQYVLREYLAYRMYNEVSDCSFRVRALDIVYDDTERRRRKQDRPRRGFVIEDRKDVARRCGGKYAKVDKVARKALVPEATNTYELFQYLIANTDWSMLRGPDGDRCCHNAILVRLPDDRYVPVPYDFDAAGFVNAPYAAPSEKLGIDSVTERLYRGFCRPDDVVAATIAHFDTRRDALTGLVRAEQGLTNSTRRTLLRYVERFYDTLHDPRERERAIHDDCR